MSFRIYLSIKKLLEEGCSEPPRAIKEQLLLLEDCYEESGKVCCQGQESVALWAVLQGLMSEYEASRYLNWKAFEAFVARALEEAGFETMRNVRVWGEGKLAELDVVGYDGEKAIVVECKRWNKTSPSVVRRIAEEHARKVRRTSYWLSRLGKVALPVVVTLKGRPMELESLVVPIRAFEAFLEEIDVAFVEGPVIRLSSSR